MIGDSVTTAMMQKALDGVWQRQRAISNNIANHETPGYKSIKVDFETSLKKEVRKLGNEMGKGEAAKTLAGAQIGVYFDNSTANRADGNNVDMDLETIEMAKAQIQYQYLTRSMTDTFARLRYAISEGKK